MKSQVDTVSSNDTFHVATPDISSGLRRSCLSYPEVLAQSVSVIAPSTVPAAILGLIFATAGNGAWLSFLLGMCGMVLVTLNVNQFTTRSASPGSLFTYIAQGLGPNSGVLGGWALVFAYTLTGMSTLCGFAIVGDVLLRQATGLHLPTLVWFAGGAGAACWIAMRNIQLSAKMMLVLEGVALASIIVLGVAIWARHGFEVDMAQVTLQGTSASGILVGVLLVVFGFSGFESSTSLGGEAKDPLTSIPKSLMHSVLFSGLIFVFMAYVVVLGFNGSSESLATSEAPLNYLANSMGWGPLGTIITVGVLLSFFACTLASINSTARIIFTMARGGLFFEALGEAHQTNRTPYIAVILAAAITFAAPAIVQLLVVSAFEAQGHFGTLCSFGFILVYVLITLAAPVYLHSIGKLTVRAALYSVGGIGFLVLPILGTVGFPASEMLPPIGFPESLLAAIFIGYMAIGVAWLLMERIRRPQMMGDVQDAIDEIQLQFAPVSERAA